MPFIEESLEKFRFELPEEIQLTCDTPEVVAEIKKLQDEFGFDLSDVVVFFIVGDMTLEEIPSYLENEYELDKTTAKKITDTLAERVLKPLIERVDFLNQHPEKNMTIEQEKIYTENIFKKKLVSELGSDPIIKDAVNQRLFFILANDINFKKKLEQAMHENEELLTSSPIMLEGKEQKPTINNWLKDFISHYGSQTYNSVNTSSFIVNSENGKKLTPEERTKLSDLIKIYTNIKFFPDSMPDSDDEEWQIIPFEIEKIPDSEISKSGVKSTIAEADNSPLVIKKSEPSLSSIAPKIKSEKIVVPASVTPKPTPTPEPIKAQPEIKEDDDLTELKNMLLQYPAGSLERAAIEEEIKTLESKK